VSVGTTGTEAAGPVDYALVEFPRGRSTFGAEMVSELLRLSFEGLIRVLDLLVIQKAADGSVEGFAVQELEGDDIRWLEADLANLVTEQEVQHLAAGMQPASVAGVVVWENLWAAPLTAAARYGGGRILASGRLPIPGSTAGREVPSRTVPAARRR
jgi:hypothetical protein